MLRTCAVSGGPVGIRCAELDFEVSLNPCELNRPKLQLSKLDAWGVAFPLAWVPGDIAPNSCLWGGTQAKAVPRSCPEVAGVLLYMF